mmetsp:Transcript_38029/g.95598  ORF Transcript_38029/g.95598 Transcript_38029/m.95598 type:complete len:235 (+) Transcript_38029:166-870(+)
MYHNSLGRTRRRDNILGLGLRRSHRNSHRACHSTLHHSKSMSWDSRNPSNRIRHGDHNKCQRNSPGRWCSRCHHNTPHRLHSKQCLGRHHNTVHQQRKDVHHSRFRRENGMYPNRSNKTRSQHTAWGSNRWRSCSHRLQDGQASADRSTSRRVRIRSYRSRCRWPVHSILHAELQDSKSDHSQSHSKFGDTPADRGSRCAEQLQRPGIPAATTQGLISSSYTRSLVPFSSSPLG